MADVTPTALLPARRDAPVALEIRAAKQTDIKALERDLGQAKFFADRLKRQRKGKGLLLVAWDRKRAIGVAYLWWEVADEPEIREHLAGVPLLTHLEVSADYRSHGMGTKLIHRAEVELDQRGYARVALAVEVNNLRAKELYSRLRYTEWEHGTVKCLPFDDGTPQAVEICNVMVKRLRGVAPWRNR
ncbi:GNAT family N-acetyltransferase [Lentzea alba]|uniref:GNAT family N-acetyltransferase n=1 Tax=Lentzea alba TaxID=2714351 RepID=UPI0039C0007B